MWDFFNKLRGFILDPVETFRAVKLERFTEGLKYAAIFAVIYALAAGLILALWAPAALFFAVPVVVGLVLVVLLLTGLWQHLWARLVGGEGGFDQTFNTVAYASTPAFLFGWVPIFGIFAGFWSLVLIVLGLKELHGITISRAIAAVLLSISVISVGGLIFAGLVYWVWPIQPETIIEYIAGVV